MQHPTLKTAIADWCFLPLVAVAARVLRLLRDNGLSNFPLCRGALWGAGVHPVVDHYYEPLFHPRHLLHPLEQRRALPGIDWRIDEQLKLLTSFSVDGPLEKVPRAKASEGAYFFDNGNFGGGDGDSLYHMIRHFRPRRVIEIGSGFSTLMAAIAIAENRRQYPDSPCEHVCVEPYEMPWLEATGVRVVRQRVETLPADFFSALESGDLLFIDSSHMIRPQGDVTHLFLEILPALPSGVFVHVHDIFSPRDYPHDWLFELNRMWNEQYLLEALLSGGAWQVVLALNLLWHEHRPALEERCPGLRGEAREPGSFYLRKA